MAAIERSKEGVPQWDGSASTFQEYSELAEHWEQTVPYHKRYLCGPKLLNELSGTARRFILSKRPGWLSHDGGVQTLLRHLRQHLGLPQLSEMSDYMNRYFKQSRRKRNESMNEYITRKAELYSRTEQTLQRAQTYYAPRSTSSHLASIPESGSASQVPEPHEEMQYHDAYEEQPSAPSSLGQEAAGDPGTRTPSHHDQQEWQWHAWGDWDAQGWDWSDHGWSDHSWKQSTRPEHTSTEAVSRVQLLRDFVQGWFLLQDSGLDTNEKNMVLAALRNDISFSRVAQELRSQWTDDDLRKRDQGGRASAWSIDEATEDPFQEDMASPDMSYLAYTGLNADGMALVSEAESEAQEAMAMMEKGRRTLREARARQQYVKLSRQYYGPPGRNPLKSTTPVKKENPHSSSLRCLSCGGGHKTEDCPKKHKSFASECEAEEPQAPFICLADQVFAAVGVGEKITTRQAMEQGKAVVDGGATRTLGSVTALETLMRLNQQKNGTPGLEKLDTEQRPTFGFGNSSRDQCLSTAWMAIQAGGRQGQLKVHTLDKGTGPILFSVETLRALGAVIDFEHDLVCFRKLDPERIIQLEQSSSGHQLIPLTQDWYHASTAVRSPVPSLKDFI